MPHIHMRHFFIYLKMEQLILSDEDNILFNLRDTNVMLDYDLAAFYNVNINEIREAIEKNTSRFPDDFKFVLTEEERDLISRHIPRFNFLKEEKELPIAFTNAGISMLSGLLTSEKAQQINIAIMRNFSQYRAAMKEGSDVQAEIKNLDQKLNQAFQFLMEKIDALSQKKDSSTMKPIGFRIE